MSKTIPFLFLFLTLLSCGDYQSKTKAFNTDNFEEHYIDEIKGTLLLPIDFQRVTKEKLPFIISEEDSNSVLKKSINHLERDRRDYVLFYKENNLDDVILIHKSEFVDFSKQDANRYLGLLEANMRNMLGMNYERLQKKMSQTERSKYIKIKHKINTLEKSFYQTHYVVTAAAVSFGVIELRTSVNDNEDLIKRIDYLVN